MDEDIILKYECGPNGFALKKAYEGSAGFDLCSSVDLTVVPNGKALISTDIRLIFPKHCYGRIAPRSGLAFNHHIGIGAGVIDPLYTGIIQVLIFNHDPINSFEIQKGDKIAQLVLEMFVDCRAEQVSNLFKSKKTLRGENGFGSSGK